VTLWPSSVIVGGSPVPLAGILADVTIHHGREDISDEPTATTCQLTLAPVDFAFVAGFEVGQSLVVQVADNGGSPAPRFTGSITDATLDVDRLTVIAAGEVSRLRMYEIGLVDWPSETWTARVTRCFTEAGLAGRLELVPDPTFDPMLAERTFETAGATTLGDYLAFLAGMVGALVSDRPDGDIFVQAVGGRDLDAAVPLDPADVAYAPAWIAELPKGNIVTVRYTGDQSESVTIQDDESISRYGDRPETIDTAFVSSADANRRASQRLARGAYSHWNIPQAPILRGLNLDVGSPVLLDKLPDASPSSPWTPILEGWTDTITGDEWTMTLALSDPLLSGVTLPWTAVPTSDKWNTIDPATDWTEALTLDDLEVL
jgi:hypothetical protein